MPAGSVRLWDPLIRLFHLSIAVVFVANYFFNEAGDDWHRWLGYYAAVWLLVRVLWGFSGPRSARWSDCWPSAQRLKTHLTEVLQLKPYRRLGHSPLGALLMLLMMAALAVQAITGYLMTEVDALWGADWPLLIHTWSADILFSLVTVHIAAALYESVLLGENLPLSMLTGRRRGAPEEH